MPSLFDPVQLGPFTLKNRFVLSPMTRERCDLDGVPTEIHAAYYAQRATAGLIVTGNNRISPNAACSPHSSGLHSQAQVAGYRRVTDAVHANGGVIFAQLFHSGAGGHPDILPGAGEPVSASAVSWGGPVRTVNGSTPCVVPRALEVHEIQDITQTFADSARLAKAAGFDGVEIQAASGYLMDQFFSSRTNRRTDAYGGDVVNRCRILMETFEAVAPVFGADLTGIKLSPEFNRHGTVVDDNPQETFSHLATALSDLKAGYLNVADNSIDTDYHALLRPLFDGLYIANVGFTPARAQAYIREGKADLIAFGRLFIANPDLPERIRTGAELNPLDPTTLYAGNARGLLDYPTVDVQNRP
ncbi:MAG TPA: alkene reductase [Caulobacteraceae bacterium]|jgi:N-ethylmaleimide reductase|nr:alkene reductase [Caulobacteraceae bacterium]